MEALPAPSSWSDKQRRFIDWLALPEESRSPATQQDLARELGVHEVTVSKWKRLPGFAEAVLERRRALVRVDDLAQIVAAQVKKAKAGNLAAADWVFRFAGLRAPSDEAPPDAQTHAQASASVLQVFVDGRLVEEENARRAAARAWLERFRVRDGDVLTGPGGAA